MKIFKKNIITVLIASSIIGGSILVATGFDYLSNNSENKDSLAERNICCFFEKDDPMAKGECRHAYPSSENERNCHDLYYEVAGCEYGSEDCPLGLFEYYEISDEAFCSYSTICGQKGACKAITSSGEKFCLDSTTPQRCLKQFNYEKIKHYPGQTCKELEKCGKDYDGDGDYKDEGEECDDGDQNSDIIPNACRTSCKEPYCGDGVTDTALLEDCDDGNYVNGDGCTFNCKKEGVCGNRFIDFDLGEECDKGNENSNTEPNVCRTDCTLPICGDGIIDNLFDEECDTGKSNSDSKDSCRVNCKKPRCGDLIIDTGEECDSVLGCSTSCKKKEETNTGACLSFINQYYKVCEDNLDEGECVHQSVGEFFLDRSCVDLGYNACYVYSQCYNVLLEFCSGISPDSELNYYSGHSCEDKPWENE